MTIDWNAFTPVAATTGGLLIGLAAAIFVLFNGRIAGISGILGGLLRPVAGDIGWRVAFVGGLIAAPLVLVMFIVEFALAMVSRFAPQIQVFILAMPIKSAVAIFMMVFFFPIALDFALRPAARFYGEADFAVKLLGGERSYREVLPALGPGR